MKTFNTHLRIVKFDNRAQKLSHYPVTPFNLLLKCLLLFLSTYFKTKDLFRKSIERLACSMGLPRKYILYEMGPYNYCKIYKFNETYIAYKITVES